MSNGEMYIFARLDGQSAGCGGRDEAFKAVRQGGQVVVADLRRGVAVFRKTYSDTDRLFDIGGIAAVMGMSRDGVNKWLQAGAIAPDAAPRSGKGKRRLWSWRAAYFAATLAGLSRQGVPLALLVNISQELGRARKRRKEELVSV